MTLSSVRGLAYERLGTAEQTFRCCDTEFLVRVDGHRATDVARRGRQTALSLEDQLNAFDPGSAVTALNADGHVENEHVARIVTRGLEYHNRTGGVFDIRQGRVEHELKSYLGGDVDSLPTGFDEGTVDVDGDRVRATVPVDLNGLAKGYIVDRVFGVLSGLGRSGFVSGGGDTSPPPGPIAIESPYGDSSPLKVLETDWNVATSGGYRRRRKGTDHIYDPTRGRLGSRHESVTVVAKRDCMEADALATTLAAMPTEDGLELVANWPDVEALVVHSGVFHRTEGFEDHVVDY